MLSNGLVGSEDCLFLNVFAPKEKKSNDLPVMVFIHGGAFVCGDSNVHKPNYFMDEQVILVTLNYRLAALGFLNTGDSVVRGNMGLKDQLMALTWINSNIKYFGGDPNRVTLFGESAGAASVCYHILSPRSKGLFSKAIAQSGTSLNFWAMYPHPKKQSQRFAAKFGCSVEDSKEMVACLKKINAADLVKEHIEMRQYLKDGITVFVPTLEAYVDENTFMSEDPRVLLKEGRFYKVPMIAGVTSEEGLVTSAIMAVNQTKLEEANERFTWWLSRTWNIAEDDEKAKLVRKFYFGNNDNIATASLLTNYTNCLSDGYFFVSNHQYAKLYSDHAPIRLYYYTHKGYFSLAFLLTAGQGRFPFAVNVFFEIVGRWFRRTVLNEDIPHWGAAHSDELPLFFQYMWWFRIHTNSKDFDLSANIVKLWVSFATNEASKDLTYTNLKWPTVSSKDSQFTYLQIDTQPQLIDEPFRDRVEFRERLFPS
ncbi:Venom carboxylesterase-6 [Pseudolycoriella hygida]|uniref:Carboxylic ester hydrolase n=1 Tax=Pseudolycoriella hygida TaxID=35572 RepID=A0A9Q0NGA9_9DIPT|nr:Venom carboxylesterase-6 [Pseudolycoriella hygida]